MMNFQEDKINAPIFFKEYLGDKAKLNIGDYDLPLILSSTEILSYDEKIFDVKDINDSHLEILLESNPEVILIGTGAKQTIPQIEIISELAQVGKSVDFMNSNSACRTYNLLVNEKRSVSCIII